MKDETSKPHWEKIAKSLARSVIRLENDPYGSHVSDRCERLARKIVKNPSENFSKKVFVSRNLVNTSCIMNMTKG